MIENKAIAESSNDIRGLVLENRGRLGPGSLRLTIIDGNEQDFWLAGSIVSEPAGEIPDAQT